MEEMETLNKLQLKLRLYKLLATRYQSTPWPGSGWGQEAMHNLIQPSACSKVKTLITDSAKGLATLFHLRCDAGMWAPFLLNLHRYLLLNKAATAEEDPPTEDPPAAPEAPPPPKRRKRVYYS